jgi:hypothetical protein
MLIVLFGQWAIQSTPKDINDRWVEDNRDREEAFYRQWSIDHIPPPTPPVGARLVGSACGADM